MVLFVVILAFLVGRVRAGADPGLARETTQAPQQQSQQQPQSTPGFDPGTGSSGTTPPSQVDPSDPFADPQQGGGGVDPGTGADDNFGNAVPDGSNQGNQSADPPSTHVS